MIFKFRVFPENQGPTICRVDTVSVRQNLVKFQLAPTYHLDTETLKLKFFKSESFHSMGTYECTINKNMLNIEKLCMNPQFEDYLG